MGQMPEIVTLGEKKNPIVSILNELNHFPEKLKFRSDKEVKRQDVLDEKIKWYKLKWNYQGFTEKCSQEVWLERRSREPLKVVESSWA